MYASDPVVKGHRNVARKGQVVMKQAAKRAIIESRRTGKPLPDRLAARYPFLVGQLGDPMPSYVELPDLGLGFALPGAIKTAGSVLNFGGAIKSVPVVGGLFAKNKDPGRYASNQNAYNVIVSGKPGNVGGSIMDPQQALAFLLQKSPVKNGGQGGWANMAPQEDAYKKYVAGKDILAKRARANAVPGAVAIKPIAAPTPVIQAAPKPPASTTSGTRPKPSWWENAINTVIGGGQQQQQAPSAYPQGPSGAGPSAPPDVPVADNTGDKPAGPPSNLPLLIGGAVIAGLVLSKGSGRRSLW